MVPLDRFTVVLDACTLFPMLVRDVLLTLAGHEFFNPKWSGRIRAEWTRNLSERLRMSLTHYEQGGVPPKAERQTRSSATRSEDDRSPP